MGLVRLGDDDLFRLPIRAFIIGRSDAFSSVFSSIFRDGGGGGGAENYNPLRPRARKIGKRASSIDFSFSTSRNDYTPRGGRWDPRKMETS